MNRKNKLTSQVLVGDVGKTVLPESFAASNYIANDRRYDYEGNWAFCRFQRGEVLGARFGFGRGGFDGRDYGGSITPESFLMLHLELMLRDGAVLWLGTGKYRARQVRLSRRTLDARLRIGGREIFHIRGWPHMRWHFQSDDGEAEVNVRLDLKNVTVLPDNRMRYNSYGMWLAIARVKGRVRFQRRRYLVEGTAFYDHPRTLIQRNRAPAFGWYIYTPMHFADGSCLASYYTEDTRGRCMTGYSFGLYIDPEGKATWLPRTELKGLRFDGDDKPRKWQTSWKVPGLQIRADSAVKPTRIVKAWGTKGTAQTRKANPNIPLIFDCRAVIVRNGKVHTTRGGGLAEYAGRAAWW